MLKKMIKILVCMCILIFYSNNVFSKTNKNIINKTNFQIQAIILSNLGSGLGLSYKLKNNLVQIVNYDLYLKNINTKYIIEFANNIVLEIYNIFKKNIDYWLSTNNSNAYITYCQYYYYYSFYYYYYCDFFFISSLFFFCPPTPYTIQHSCKLEI